MLREIFPVLVAGVLPLFLVGLIVVGPSLNLVEWKLPVLWTDQFGTICEWHNYGYVEATHSEATSGVVANTGLYVTGYLNESSTYSNYFFLRRYDTNGHTLWMRTFLTGYHYATGTSTVDMSGVYVGAAANNEASVQKWDFEGNQEWNRTIPGTGSDQSSSFAHVISVSTGALYVGVDNLYSNFPITVRAFDLTGNVLWTQEYGDRTENSVTGIFATPTMVYVTDNIELRGYASNGTLLWSRLTDGPADGISGDATGLYLTGTDSYQKTGFLSKYSFDGTLIWKVFFHPSGYYGVKNPIISIGSGGIYIYYGTDSAADFLVSYDESGNSTWTTATLPALGVVVGPDGIYFSGGNNCKAFETKLGLSKSLVFFGLNPPLSFVTVGLLVVGTVSYLAWFGLRSRRLRSVLFS